MNNLRQNLFLLFLLLFSIQTAYAETKLASLIQDHMVLQRESEVLLWGWDTPGQKIKVTTSWSKDLQTITNNEGKWKIILRTPKAGGPYKLHIKGSSSHDITDILMGDVWVCSGQSNMYMPIKGYRCQPVEGSNDMILSANNDNIRFFKVGIKLSAKPLNKVKGEWKVSSIQNAPDFSAVAYNFAQEIQKSTGVPVGIISTSRGASTIEAWMDPTSLKLFNGIPIPTKVPENNGHKTATLLFNGMINPITNYKAKGFLWYQGEANCFNPENYARLSQAMIGRWRQLWGDAKMPFYFVQIAPYNYKGRKASELKEQQNKVLDLVENTGMAVTLDVGSYSCIHPQKKQIVGKRLAYLALNKTYGYKTISCDPPMLDHAEGLGSTSVKVYLKNTANGLTTFDQKLLGFEVADSDKKFHFAVARINRKDNSITVECSKVKSIQSVRYAFKDYIPATLYNTAGIPATCFRTDNW
ncbi:sialate O-acetylesterase [Halosquirtibacter laminarini]|uniref:Sialate O-acetylesterase n=1 Tax=Halosquirtibacter laminarini TaxID=3374600 RepID=A0AC61NIM5_9BACT|nr:sialate O-acetylesterase [Prolixibacteraceae bacterium]